VANSINTQTKQPAPMNKQDLVSELSQLNGLSKTEAKKIVELAFGAMVNALVEGRRVEIRGLCTIKVKAYGAYKGRNPHTGESLDVKPKKLPYFKPGADLKKRMNL
jgi:integration host factor subunit beta